MLTINWIASQARTEQGNDISHLVSQHSPVTVIPPPIQESLKRIDRGRLRRNGRTIEGDIGEINRSAVCREH